MNTARMARLVLALVAGAGVLSGAVACSSPRGSTAPPTGAPPTATTPVAPDAAPMTRADYEAAVGELEKCLAQSRIELVNEGWDPVDQHGMILGYRAPTMADQKVLDLAQTCRAAHFDAVEARFRRDNPAHMAPDLMTAVQACLTGKGFAVTGREENPEDLIRLVPRDRLRELAACVQESGRRLYPELPIEFP